MLQLRPTCEHCTKFLPAHSEEAMICSYECTFCRDCVDNVLQNVCPNCGGGFQARPVRPKTELLTNPASEKVVEKSIDLLKFKSISEKYLTIKPSQR